MKPLRDHQSRSIDLLRQSLRSGSKRPILQLPTGAGKTRVASEIINLALAKGNRVIFTVPAISLVDQTAREFWDEGIRDVGVMQANHPMTDPRKPVQIASIQTLQQRKIPEAGMVIIDEAHKVFKFVAEWMALEEWLSVPFIGLSATPWTKGLGRLYDKLIIGSTTSELIEAGYLSNFKTFAPSHPDLKGVRTIGDDFHEGDIAQAMNPLIGDVVSTWQERGEGRPTLCFAVNCMHARLLQEQFIAAGVSCGYVDKDTTRDERETVRKAFALGEYKVVCNVGVLTTGVDWDVRCIILARPTKSEILFTQIIGRGLRTANGKDDCLILDHSDSTLRLGFVTDIHHSRLDGGAMDSSEGGGPSDAQPKPPRECPKCSRLMGRGEMKCPSCGHLPEKASGGVEWREGELIELDSRRKPDAAEKRRFFAELLGYARDHGKGMKFAEANFMAKYKEWPYGKNSILAVDPSPTTVNYVKSRMIAWHKGKGAR